MPDITACRLRAPGANGWFASRRDWHETATHMKYTVLIKKRRTIGKTYGIRKKSQLRG
jgi:hypothetical protein